MGTRSYFEPENDYDEDPEYAELMAKDFFEKQYRSHYFAHPHCQDHDHPGCPNCEPEDFEDEN